MPSGCNLIFDPVRAPEEWATRLDGVRAGDILLQSRQEYEVEPGVCKRLVARMVRGNAGEVGARACNCENGRSFRVVPTRDVYGPSLDGLNATGNVIWMEAPRSCDELIIVGFGYWPSAVEVSGFPETIFLNSGRVGRLSCDPPIIIAYRRRFQIAPPTWADIGSVEIEVDVDFAQSTVRLAASASLLATDRYGDSATGQCDIIYGAGRADYQAEDVSLPLNDWVSDTGETDFHLRRRLRVAYPVTFAMVPTHPSFNQPFELTLRAARTCDNVASGRQFNNEGPISGLYSADAQLPPPAERCEWQCEYAPMGICEMYGGNTARTTQGACQSFGVGGTWTPE